MSTGISGFASYFPRHQVDLEDLAEWTGNNPAKLRAVVGDSFRLCGLDEDCYTMASAAVVSLIQRYEIDPLEVGYLALATESSTDNSAGAVIVKGLVDQALAASGQRRLARDCEVPEFKHACLGGMYALKSAVRYLRTDGKQRVAIVVCSDQALYERGSSGEPTQGSGATAMLIDANAGA